MGRGAWRGSSRSRERQLGVSVIRVGGGTVVIAIEEVAEVVESRGTAVVSER